MAKPVDLADLDKISKSVETAMKMSTKDAKKRDAARKKAVEMLKQKGLDVRGSDQDVYPPMSDFLRRHPEVSGELLFVNRVVNLVEEGIDAAVRIGSLPDSSLVAIPLGKVRRVMCASPAYLRANGVPRRLEELRGHRGVRVTGLAQPRKVSMASVLTCNQAEAAIEACTDGLGIGSFVSYMVAPQVRAGRLKYVLEDFEAEPLPVSFLYPQSRQLSPTVRAFADLCVRKLRGVAFD